tara:strand:- start:231 stop:743 length:513 start_codon:yes stop_codon:yes gene_type:complete
MRANYFGFFIILLFFSSCTNLSNVNKVENKIETPNLKTNKITNCPSSYIPKETMYLTNKKKERVLKISKVKLECSLSSSLKDNETQYVTINQTIFYQVLKKKVKLNQKNKLIYIALVDEKRSKIKAKVLSKIQITSRIKSANKIYFKNTNTFNIKNNENNNYVFYYGFQY